MKCFELGHYTGLRVQAFDTNVTNEEIIAALEYVKNSIVDEVDKNKEPIAKGDYVIVDFAGKCGEKVIPGGAQNGYRFQTGDEMILPEFTDNVLGKKKGDTVVFETVIQSQYPQFSAMLGKKATFTVKIKKVTEETHPELTDEIISEIIPKADTMEELKQLIVKKICSEKQLIARDINVKNVIHAIAIVSKVEFDEGELDKRAEQLYKQFEKELKTKDSLELIIYLMERQITASDFLQECREEAGERIVKENILDAVIKEEKITVSEKDLAETKRRMLEAIDDDEEEFYKTFSDDTALKTQFLRRKAMDFLLSLILV